ncbi:unnamed protein product [Adineta steineri]|uniref:Enoyl reductase (ER) domain-containing protein n=1 Tax=Adineta steineri TaxID=433720 RepID=A0A815LGT3_9BILA|nr:unnamed protein product [Adineta steineri]CAF3987998.1 unnamed protein product [Adineta steineri]
MESSRNNKSEIPSVMRAAQQTNFGNVRDVLTLSDNVPVPRELSSKEILVRVYAASINPSDWKILSGMVSIFLNYSWPHIPGSDVSGIIVDVGSAVNRLHIGDDVYGNVGIEGGAFAEYVRTDESSFAINPKNLTMVEAAAIPLACETSYQVLFHNISPSLKKGNKIFICGGSSACGLFAIQLAKSIGASVATTCASRNFQLIEKLGYQIIHNKSELINEQEQIFVIDYNEKDFGEELKDENYDIVYDCVGGIKQWISAQKTLKQYGQFITLVGDDPKPNISIKYFINLTASIINRKFWFYFSSVHHNYIWNSTRRSYHQLDDLRINYIETNKVKPVTDTIFDWTKDDVGALYLSYEKSKSGKAQGKLILKIIDEQ